MSLQLGMRASTRRGHPTLVIHGGAGSQSRSEHAARVRHSLERIAWAAGEFLQTHAALETVVFAVQLLEDDPLFNAGTGSLLQRDGRAQMSASVMDGATRRFAAVLNIERVRNPVRVARLLLDEPDRVLAGEPATCFARAKGFLDWDPVTPERRKLWEDRARGETGTVGAVALDTQGRLAAATSTGGKGFERVGRVSDSGTPAGNFANAHAAVSATGIGEEILDEGLAVRLVDRARPPKTLRESFQQIFAESRKRDRRFGAIGVDAEGHVSWHCTLPMLTAVAFSGNKVTFAF